MVTSTPGILLLPMLICLQHCINVHGKCRVRVRVLCVRVSSVFRCVLGITALGNTHRVRWGLANFTERYTCLGCSLKEWPCSATPWASQPCAPTQEGDKKETPEKTSFEGWKRDSRCFVCVLKCIRGAGSSKLVIDSAGGVFFFLAQYLRFFEMREKRGDGEARVVCVACCTAFACRCSFMAN